MDAAFLTRLVVAGTLGAAICAAGPSRAQEINNRTKASPGTDAITAQVIAEARLKAERGQQSAGQATDTLVANKVSNGVVDTGCNAQIGGQQTDSQAAAPRTLVGRNGGVSTQNTTVVLGSTVLLCSHP